MGAQVWFELKLERGRCFGHSLVQESDNHELHRAAVRGGAKCAA